jgi:predicted MFS family arabinose efflux permease
LSRCGAALSNKEALRVHFREHCVVGPSPVRPGRAPETATGDQPSLLFAIAGGAAVANLHWAQPLLDFIARDLRPPPPSRDGWSPATQIGYADGILLIVPLGDVVDRRRLIPLMMLLSAVVLVGCALAPSIGVLLVAITALGLTTVPLV